MIVIIQERNFSRLRPDEQLREKGLLLAVKNNNNLLCARGKEVQLLA
jgi:hypothetical protein